MKEMILLLCGILMGRQLYAQTFSEWFRQNHTQLKYLAGQIAALDVYDGLVKQGYGIEQEGLDSIGGIDAGDLKMHTEHLSALDKPSVAVREDAAVAAIRQYFVLIPLAAEEVERIFRVMPTTNNDWPAIGVNMGNRLRDVVAEGEKWLSTILGEDGYRMDDANRLHRLTGMQAELKKTYGDVMFLLAQFDLSALNPLL